MFFWISRQEVYMAVTCISLEINVEQMEFDKLKDKQSVFAHNHPYPHLNDHEHVSFW